IAFLDQPGFGAAGGIALGLSVFFETEIKFGSKYFFEQVNLKEKVNWADIIITGEGRYDSQSAEGKACYELMQLARSQYKKIILITSGKEEGVERLDKVLNLPELDFSKLYFEEKSRPNLRNVIAEEFFLDF